MLVSLAARTIPLAARALPTILSGLTTDLLSDGITNAISGDGFCTNMINAIEYRNVKAMVSI